MKNNFFFKFLAILLCAASLMGVVGAAAGAMTLVEGDLYRKTVDEVIAQRVQNLAADSAYQIATRFADQTLGGCPEEISRSYGNNLLARNFTSYGYAILDGEGNVLESLNPELKDSTKTHSIPITGQYMHLVSTETEAEKLARETAARMDSIGRGMVDMNGEAVPREGVPVNQVIFTDQQGTPIYEAAGNQASCSSTFYRSDGGNILSSSYDHGPRDQIGFLYYGTDDQLMYRSFLNELDHNFSSAEVYGVTFLSYETGFLFQTERTESLGLLAFENGHLCFTGYPDEAAPAETVPAETAPEETIPETTAETLPAETLLETEAVEQTQATEAEEGQEDQEEWTEEAQVNEEEDSEEEQEASSASADPEEENYEEAYDSDENAEEGEESEETSATEAEISVTEPLETLPEETVAVETIPEETVPQETEPTLINGKPLEAYQVNRAEYVNHITGEHTTAKYVYLPMPELTVEVYVDQDALDDTAVYNVLRLVRQYRSYLLPVIGICLLLFALSAVYLCTVAGRNSKTEEIKASGLNRLPLDLYLTAGIFLGTGLAALAFAGVPVLLNSDFLLGCSLAVAAAFVCCLLFTGFFFAIAAQVKTPGGFWWRNLLCVRFVFLCMRLLQWLEVWLREKVFPWLGYKLKKAWALIWTGLQWLYETTEKLTAKSGKKLNHFFSLIPLTWQWVVCGMLLFCLLLLACNTRSELLTLICLAASFALILYGCHCFGILLASARKMGKGDLNTKVTSKLMVGSFKDFADDLNDLADVAKAAAQNQLKSERMKTELITNVSHDIKTPLTSIINYVDLLQKPHTEEENVQYLEVLDRQSQRLKKLVEDLMDMSKASTGNMEVEITTVDAVESVNQALGEFADKLERAHLHPVFRHSEAYIPIMADGKLVWRVLSNLLGNAVKYAMPGTRIYLDLSHVGDKVILSLKNISREELNINAEELMERFVRGDISRNTEGSGLGLNIAKSLMELQGGNLQLLVDGDLFKVTLIFPEAK